MLNCRGRIELETTVVRFAADRFYRVCAVWACQDMVTVDIAGGHGPRATLGHLTLIDAPGACAHPDDAALVVPVACDKVG